MEEPRGEACGPIVVSIPLLFVIDHRHIESWCPGHDGIPLKPQYFSITDMAHSNTLIQQFQGGAPA